MVFLAQKGHSPHLATDAGSVGRPHDGQSVKESSSCNECEASTLRAESLARLGTGLAITYLLSFLLP
jgi:hypothetical protein